jgi:hypothetical protein
VSDDLDAHLAAASTVTLRLRMLGALLSSSLVLLTWSLARRFARPGTALLATFFVATSLLHIVFSQQARPHGPHATLALLAVLAAMRMQRRPTYLSYGLAGLAAAAALACLQSGVAVLLPVCLAHLLREPATVRETSLRFWERRPSGGSIVTLGGLVLLATFGFYPFRSTPLLGIPARTGPLDSSAVRQGTHEVDLSNFDGSGFRRIPEFLYDHDPVLFVLASAGLVLAFLAWRRSSSRRDLWVPLAYSVPYFAAVGAYRDSLERFLLPLLPYLACLAALAVTRAARAIARRVPEGRLRLLAGACVVLPPLALAGGAALRYAVVRDAPNAIQQASAWIRANVPANEGAIVVTPDLTLPLFHDPSTFENNRTPILASVWVSYQERMTPSPTRGPVYRVFTVPWERLSTSPPDCPRIVDEEFERIQPAWAVVEVSARILNRSPISRALYQRVRERGELVFEAEGEPVGRPIQRPLDYQNMPGMLRRLLTARCLGPRIEVWRLRSS